MATAASVFAAAVSVAANVFVLLDRGPVGWAVGATAPVVFVFAVELATKCPSTGGSLLTRLRAGIAVLIGLGAAFVSFSHLAEVVRSVGEHGAVAYVLPVLVDSVVVVGVLTLHDTADQLKAHELALAAVREAERLAVIERAEAEAREAAEAQERERRRAERAAAKSGRARAVPEPVVIAAEVVGDDPSLAPAARVRRLKEMNPDLTQPQIGKIVGRSERQVRRDLDQIDVDSEPDRPDVDGAGVVLNGARSGEGVSV
jgi:hypothetical protein